MLIFVFSVSPKRHSASHTGLRVEVGGDGVGMGQFVKCLYVSKKLKKYPKENTRYVFEVSNPDLPGNFTGRP